jgi:adenylate cyclase
VKLPARWIPQLSINTWLRIAAGLALVFVFFVNEAEFYQLRFVQQLELWAYDTRLRLFLPNTRDPRIVILDIDEKSLNAEGHWPWSRNKLAVMVKQLFDRYQVKVIGFDIAFPETDPSSGLGSLEELAKTDLKDDAEYQKILESKRGLLDYDRIFADEVGKHPVVLGFFLGDKTDRSGVLPPPVFRKKEAFGTSIVKDIEASGFSGNIQILQDRAAAVGHLYPQLDFDGVSRRVPLYVRFEDGYYEAMSFAVTRTYLGNLPAKLNAESLGHNIVNIPWVQTGDLRVPLDDRMSALIPYRGPGRGASFQYVSATDVIRGTLPDTELRGKIIIVGTSAQGLLDLRSTPVDAAYPGVEVHANLISGFLDQTIMHKPAEVLAIHIFVILLFGIPFAAMLPRLSAATSTAAAVVTILVIVAANLYIWKAQHLVLDISAPLMMMAMLYLLNMAWGFFMETRSRRLISGLFGTYVPKELVAEMSKNPEVYSMRGEARDMTVLFSDVRDFTSISEGLPPEGLRDMMNAYLTEMTEVIQQTRGTIDKYIGDAIMSFWGAPLDDAGHAAHGVEAALAMQKKIRGLDTQFAKNGWPPLNIGVGLNCGTMNVGDMGSKFRRAYTVMGDAVNIASRLEGLTKEYGVGILVSEDMVQAAQGFVYREVDLVAVKGRTAGIPIFEPIGKVGEVLDTTLTELDKWHKGLEQYRKQRWDDAQEIFKTLQYASPDTKLYKLYLKRIDYWRTTTPGPLWKGLWVWTTK